MSMQIVNLIQGSQEWHTHRRAHFNASDAPAMMACSSYKSRADLIKELATGLVDAEIDPATARRFADGHRFEALARPLAEEIIGDELSPCVGTSGKFSASFDGLTFMHDTAFEHKTLNNTLRAAMVPGCTGADLPLQYQVQMEHQAMVSGCQRILFMTSEWAGDGTLVEERHCWYEPNPELRAKIVAGWVQLEKDVAAFNPAAERPAAVVAEPVESLPAVVVKMQGDLVVAGNLQEFGAALSNFIERIPKKPETDQDFANADAACKVLKKVEDGIEAEKASALNKFVTVEEAFRLMDDYKTMARAARLATEKLVAAKKDALRLALVTGAQQELDQHVAALNKRLGSNWLPRIAGGFAETIKNKKSLQNMQDAVAVALTNAKAEANDLAQRLEVNRHHLVQDGTDWIALFADFATVGTKEAEDFQALAALRIGQHRQAEAQRLEVERERIRAEEQAKAKAEAAEQERQRIQQQAQQEQAEIAQAQQAGTLAAPVAGDLAGLVLDKAAEGVAGVDAQEAIAAAKTSAAAAANDGQTVTLGQINTLIAPIKVDAAGLAELGFTATTIKAAKHYPASDVPRILAAMVKHLQGVMATA